MFKRYFLFLLFFLIYLNSALAIQTVPLDEPFIIKDSKSVFSSDETYTYRELLKCNPKLNAIYKVDEGTHTLKVIPEKQLHSGVTYSCKYGKSIIKFRTKPFSLRDYHYFKREKLVRVEFNDNIDPKVVKKYIKLTKKDKLSTTDLTYAITQQNSNTLLLKIKEPVYNSIIELTIDKGLKNIYGNSLEDTFSTTFNSKKPLNIKLDSKKRSMGIYNKPRMISLDNGEFAIRLFFSDEVFSNSIKNLIEIDGVDNFQVSDLRYIDFSDKKRFKLLEGTSFYIDLISPEFKPNHTYKITIKKGIRSYGNLELKEDKEYTVKSGDLAKSIFFNSSDNKSYISNSGELSFSTINLDRATVIIQKVLDDNLRYFINYEQYGIDEFLSSNVITKDIIFNSIKNKVMKQKFKLSSLEENLPFGIYKITLRYSDGEKEKKVNKVLYISNIGISVNISKTQAFIHTMKLDSSESLISAMVYLYGKNNELLGYGKSDKYGVVTIEDSNLLSKKPSSVIVETKSDRNFLYFESPISSPSMEILREKSSRFRANIYLQSNIIRPASKVNALITVKDREFISAKKLPVKIEVKYDNNLEIYNKIYHTDEYGLIDFNYQFDIEDKTGNYTILAKMGNIVIGRKDFKVEAFIPPKIETDIKLSKDNYSIGEIIDVNISSNYLFGNSASHLHGKVELFSDYSDFSLNRYKGYSFSNHKGDIKGYISYNETIRLDSKGKLNLAIKPQYRSLNNIPSTLRVTLGVTIMDDNQPISKYKKFNFFPYKSMVGLRVDTKHLEKGKELKGRAVLINPITGDEIDRELYAVIKKVNWHYSYNGLNSNWEKEITNVESFKIKPNELFSRKISQNGNYFIEVHDRLEGHSASSSFDVWWQDYNNISPDDNLDTVEISFENRLYKKGDTIIAKIKSPILKGDLLLTLEDDKVEGYKVVHMEKGVAKVEMPIKFDIKKGAYLHATVYRATDTSSKLIPFRAIGYKYVKPDNSSHKIDIKIDAPSITKSKNRIKVDISTSKPSKILVSVVDKGILQVTNQKKPNIFGFFDSKTEQKVSYYDMYDNLIEYLADGKMVDFGAGDLISMKKKHLSPDLGKRVKPFMIWSGVIDIPKGKGAIGINIPQFSGRATITAIAINEDSIGVASKDFTVKDDIMITPSYPLYSLKGDKLIVPIRIFNTTKEVKDIRLTSISSKNIEFTIKDINITISPKSSTVVNAILNAKEVGKGKIDIEAKFDKNIVTYSTELSVYTPYAVSTKSFRGISSKRESFTIPKKYIGGKAYITISDNLLGLLGNDLKYLVTYPYGCVEQVSSKILAMHYAKPFLKDTSLVAESEHLIKVGIRTLINKMDYIGEFQYWGENSYINPYASLYASETILNLSRDGFNIPSNIIDNILYRLKNILDRSEYSDRLYTNFHRVYAGYILAENGKLSTSQVNMLLEKGIYKSYYLSKYYMSAILKIKGRDRDADRLYNSVGKKLSSYLKVRYSNSGGDFNSNIRDMLLHFIIKTKYFKKDAKDLEVVERSLRTIYSTQERALALKAISLYLGKPTNSKLDVDLTINGESRNYRKATSFEVENIKGSKVLFNLKSDAMSYNIEFVKNLPKRLKNRLSKSKNISIKRVFIDENKRRVDLDNLKWGDRIYSKITISNYGEFKNLVVDQKVPSCFTVVNSRVQNSISDSRFNSLNIDREYKDIRDDRVLNFIDLKKKERFNRKSRRNIVIENRATIFTPFIVTTKGECRLPAVTIESMYDSRINDYAKEAEKIIVSDNIKKDDTL